MSMADKQKWDKKYTQMEALMQPRPPSAFMCKQIAAIAGGKAIDIACGTGRNALYLAQEGFEVDAVDISAVALNALKKQVDSRAIVCIEADLDTYAFNSAYDLAVICNFLDRALITRALQALNPSGVLVIETFMHHEENEKSNSNPDYLLKPKELQAFCTEGFALLDYGEYWNEAHELYKMRKQAIAIKKL